MQVVMILTMVYVFIFSYIPMVGIIIAFKDFKVTDGILGFFTTDWVGLKYFREFFTDFNAGLLLRNTIVISLLKLAFTFPIPILFAICLNEVGNGFFKRLTQTISYLPHFVSWVVISGIIFSFFNQQNGLINQVLLKIGWVDQPVDFLTNPNYYWAMAVISDIWKETGWWAIIFLAAITGVDSGVIEASIVDGAGRLRRIWSIILPSIRGTITVVLIMAIGSLLGGGLSGSNFEQSYLLGNQVNYSTSEIIQTYTLRVGLANGRFAYAQAISLFQSIISLVLVFSSNAISKKVSGTGLF